MLIVLVYVHKDLSNVTLRILVMLRICIATGCTCTGRGSMYISFSWSHTNDMFVVQNDACLLGRGSFLQAHDLLHIVPGNHA